MILLCNFLQFMVGPECRRAPRRWRKGIKPYIYKDSHRVKPKLYNCTTTPTFLHMYKGRVQENQIPSTKPQNPSLHITHWNNNEYQVFWVFSPIFRNMCIIISETAQVRFAYWEKILKKIKIIFSLYFRLLRSFWAEFSRVLQKSEIIWRNLR